MNFNSLTLGVIFSVLLFIPVGLLDLYIVSDNSIGNWALVAFVLPYLVYFGLAAGLWWNDYTESAKGLAVSGAAFSTLIVMGILLLAVVLGAATEG